MVDLPEPVGPVTSRMPCGLRISLLQDRLVVLAQAQLVHAEHAAATA